MSPTGPANCWKTTSTGALGMLMQARDPQSGQLMQDRQLLDEILTLIVAGHETTVNLIANGMLTIRGEKQEEKEEEKQDYYVRERSFGSFERTFQVPGGVDLDKVDASFKKGVLTVTLPKTAEAQKAEKKITVRTE